jgi:hypothetical protein
MFSITAMSCGRQALSPSPKKLAANRDTAYIDYSYRTELVAISVVGIGTAWLIGNMFFTTRQANISGCFCAAAMLSAYIWLAFNSGGDTLSLER